MAKRIGILTSGGDCAGLNAVIRAVYARAVGGYGWQVVGIRNGTAGLLARPVMADVLDARVLASDMLRMGGTILGTTNKGDPFAYAEEGYPIRDRSDEVIEGYRMLGLDALIGIGGDGSMRILDALAGKGGFPLIAIPKTIDNDVGHTEVSIGHETAVAVAADALDRLQPTAASHSRVMVLEVMGRDAGHIALSAGIAGGADFILIPEIAYRFSRIAERLEEIRAQGRNFALVIVAEAAPMADGHAFTSDGRLGGIGHYIGAEIARLTGAETRVTVLGHVQRGGMPQPRDRILASAFGVRAVDLIAMGKAGRMVAWTGRQVVDVPITLGAGHCHRVDPDGILVQTARGLGISFGD